MQSYSTDQTSGTPIEPDDSDATPFTILAEPERRWLSVTGELDLATAPALSTAIGRALEQSGDLTIDMSQTSFVDSVGLAVFVRTSVRQREGGHSLRLLGLSPRIRRLFVLTGLTGLIDELPVESW